MTPTRLLATSLLLGLPALTLKPAPSEELRGIITQIQGAVEVLGPGAGDIPLASPWQVIRAGVTLRLPPKGSAGIVCSTRRFVRLLGPASWSLTPSTCAAGKELTPGEYSWIVPQGGRFKVVEGLLVLEREIRGNQDDDPLAPSVLSPRNTVLRSSSPRVTWSRVPAATSYWVQWTGGGIRDHSTPVEARNVPCSGSLEGRPVCSLPWPEGRPALSPGKIYFLRVGARSGGSDDWHFNDPVEVEIQETPQTARLERDLEALQALGLEGQALDIARAGLFAQNGLYADAADQYRRILIADADSDSELRVTLADLDFVMGLGHLAEPLYREAWAGHVPSIRAAAAFGLGRVAYARGHYEEAATSFHQAFELYKQLGLGEEENAARRAFGAAKARIPK